MASRSSYLIRERRALLIALSLALVLPGPALAQEVDDDSIAVIERGTPGATGWDVAEFPFKVITAPLYLLALGAEWGADALSDAHAVNWALYTNTELNKRSLYPQAAGLGSGSGTGVALLAGAPPRAGTAWGYLRGDATHKLYWRLMVRAGLGDEVMAGAPGGRFGISVFGLTEGRPEEEYFGVGRNSSEADRSDYELRRRVVGGQLGLTPTGNTAISLELDWSRVESMPGANSRLPDTDSLFSVEDVPRFGETDRYLSIRGLAEWQNGAPGPASAGTWVRIGVAWNRSDSDGAADFAEIDVGAGGILPFDHARRSLALSAHYRTARRSGSGVIPFYRLPTLGGTSSLSAYRTNRFRGRDLVLGRAEYYYRLWLHPLNPSAVFASIFMHAGMVASDMDAEFRFDRLKPSYGTALTVAVGGASSGRLELAAGDEGLRVNLSFMVGS